MTTPGNNTYAYYEGTSMAAPHVTGIVSLMLSLNPSLTPDQVLTYLQANVTAFPSGSTCNTSLCGTGIVNAASVLTAIATNVGVGPGNYEDIHLAIIYSDNWTQVNLQAAGAGSYRNSNKVGATASLTVNGARTFIITSSTAGNRGIANVLVDGNVVGTIDGYGPTAYRVQFGPYPLPDTGQHTITLQVTGTKNPNSKNIAVTLDNFLIRGGKTKFEDNAPEVSYVGKWKLVNLLSASGRTFHKSTEANVTASVVVTGAKSFAITTIKAKNRGIANVLVDGNVVGTIDAYDISTQYKWRSPYYSLPDTGTHTIALQVTGTKNPQSKGVTVTLDNFLIKY